MASTVRSVEVTSIEYIAGPGRSMIEVYRSYEQALAQGGFQILFKCAGHEDCGRLDDYMKAAYYSIPLRPGQGRGPGVADLLGVDGPQARDASGVQ